jgi:hypothetical protein
MIGSLACCLPHLHVCVCVCMSTNDNSRMEVLCWGPGRESRLIVPGPVSSMSLHVADQGNIKALSTLTAKTLDETGSGSGGDIKCWDLIKYDSIPLFVIPAVDEIAQISLGPADTPSGSIFWALDYYGELTSYPVPSNGIHHSLDNGLLAPPSVNAAMIAKRAHLPSIIKRQPSCRGQPEDPFGYLSGTCALQINGDIRCFARNGSDIWPFDDTISSNETFVQVAQTARSPLVCGITWEGHARCVPVMGIPPQPQPPTVGTPAYFAPSMGEITTCGLKNDSIMHEPLRGGSSGQPWCFGLTEPGDPHFMTLTYIQLGASDVGVCGVTPEYNLVCSHLTPIQLAPLPSNGVRQVELAANGAPCVLLINGRVMCSDSHPLPPPSGNDSFVFITVNPNEDLPAACGLRTDGSFRCWGAAPAQQTVTESPPGEIFVSVHLSPTWTLDEYPVVCALRQNNTGWYRHNLTFLCN